MKNETGGQEGSQYGHSCPLCGSEEVSDFFYDRKRDYFRCQDCLLIFVSAHQFLSVAEERAEYDLHQNSPYDPGYRLFLNRLFVPVQERIAPQSNGLDFGSGPGPTLSVMFEEQGHSMVLYDHHYANNPVVLQGSYDFITASEVVEHLHDPATELARLWGCLKPGGVLGIMTKLALDREAFATWHYKDDPTHVCFFSRCTFEWLAKKWKVELTFVDKDVILLFS